MSVITLTFGSTTLVASSLPPMPTSSTAIATLLVAKCSNAIAVNISRSEEHTSELQSHHDIVCRLLLEKKKTDHHIFLSAFTGVRDLSATSSGITASTPRGDIRVMDPAAFRSHFGIQPPATSHGERLAA